LHGGRTLTHHAGRDPGSIRNPEVFVAVNVSNIFVAVNVSSTSSLLAMPVRVFEFLNHPFTSWLFCAYFRVFVFVYPKCKSKRFNRIRLASGGLHQLSVRNP